MWGRWLSVVMLVAVGVVAHAQTTRPSAPATQRTPVDFLSVVAVEGSHALDVTINGETLKKISRVMSYGRQISPDGVAKCVITMTPDPAGEPTRASTMRVELQPIGDAQPIPVGSASIGSGYGEARATVQIRSGIPGRLVFEYERWADAERKQRTYHRRAEGDAFAGAYELQVVKQWSPDGKLQSEHTERYGSIAQSIDYKPDGVAGAWVIDGKGEQRTFNADGSIASETPVRDGQYHGTEKIFDAGKLAATSEYVKGERHGPIHEYYPEGKVAVRGQYEHGHKHGEWIIYNPDGTENRRVTFRRGELVEGSYDFPNWE